MGHITIKRILYLAATGGILILLGIYLGWCGFPFLISYKIKQSIILKNNTEGFKNWINPPISLQFKVYLFNLTNPEKVSQGDRPILQEVGPYIYDLYKKKVHVKFNQDGTITYYTKNHFTFSSSNTRKESETVTVANIALLGTAVMVERLFPVGLNFFNKAIPFLFPNETTVFMTVSVGDLLFHGIKIQCNYSTGPAMPICNGMKSRAPITVTQPEGTKDYIFSMFQHKNRTLEGPFTIDTGKNDVNKLGMLLKYKNLTYLSNWQANSTCSQLKGTDSMIFPPAAKLDDVYIYVPDICLSLFAKFEKVTEFEKIPGRLYLASSTNFEPASVLPENICRCREDPDDSKKPLICLKKGAIEASSCQGAPVVFTPPHFMDTDPEYASYPIGLKPDAKIHSTYVILEPKTGAPMSGRKRMQLNMELRRIHRIDLLSNVSEGLLPIAWIEEGADMNDELLKRIKTLNAYIQIIDSSKWLLIGAGFIITIIATVLYLKIKHNFIEHKLNGFGTSNKTESNVMSAFRIPKVNEGVVSQVFEGDSQISKNSR